MGVVGLLRESVGGGGGCTSIPFNFFYADIKPLHPRLRMIPKQHARAPIFIIWTRVPNGFAHKIKSSRLFHECFFIFHTCLLFEIKGLFYASLGCTPFETVHPRLFLCTPLLYIVMIIE